MASGGIRAEVMLPTEVPVWPPAASTAVRIAEGLNENANEGLVRAGGFAQGTCWGGLDGFERCFQTRAEALSWSLGVERNAQQEQSTGE